MKIIGKSEFCWQFKTIIYCYKIESVELISIIIIFYLFIYLFFILFFCMLTFVT